MLTLQRALQDQDLGYLRIVAEFWGLELESPNARQASTELARAMAEPGLAHEVVESLPMEAREALDWLLAQEGRAGAAQFSRRFGEVRPMGPARRDREMPWLDPASAAEVLWYHGLIARGFADGAASAEAAPRGPQEFYIVPDELAALLPKPQPPVSELPGQPASLPAGAQPSRATTALVDDAATVLAALRREPGRELEKLTAGLKSFLLTGAEEGGTTRSDDVPDPKSQPLALVITLLQDLGCVRGPDLELDAEVARPFLESARGEQLRALFNAWRRTEAWNDLDHILGLKREGNWTNDPRAARETALRFLARVPPDTWWSLDSFVVAIKEQQPDFQRPAGDYDSWYVRDSESGDYLRGFEHWERVDGALLRYLLTGPLHWLGATDLHDPKSEIRNPPARPAEPGRAKSQAFRVTGWGRALLAAETPKIPEPPGQLRIYPDGQLSVSRSVSRYDRFTVARFTEWAGLGESSYLYRISPASLALAQKQGLQVRHILAFLGKAAVNPVPPALAAALIRWEKQGVEVSMTEMLVLRVSASELLETLRKSPKVSRYLGETLGPAALQVRRSDWERLRAALVEVGVLVDGGNF